MGGNGGESRLHTSRVQEGCLPCWSAAVTTAIHPHCHYHRRRRFSCAVKNKGNGVQLKFSRLQSDLHSAKLFSFQRGSLRVKSSQRCDVTQQFKMALLALLASTHFLPLSSLPLAVFPVHALSQARAARKSVNHYR